MNISLTPRLEKLVMDKVKSGAYHSASEVIREGLRLLEEQDMLRQAKLEALRVEIQKGLDSGPPEPWDVNEFLERCHAEYDRRNKDTEGTEDA